jgi:hypothetical protein
MDGRRVRKLVSPKKDIVRKRTHRGKELSKGRAAFLGLSNRTTGLDQHDRA